MKLKNQNRQNLPRLSLLLGSLMVALNLIISPISASAAVFDRTTWPMYPGGSEGYFSNGGEADSRAPARQDCGLAGGRCPVLPNGGYAYESLDSTYYRNTGISSVDKVRQFIVDLKNNYILGGEHGRVGAAFVVNTLYGRNNDSADIIRDVNPDTQGAMWDDLQNRLLDRAQATVNGRPAIDWYASPSSGTFDTKSAKINGKFDIVWYDNNVTLPGIEIWNDDGTPAYRIWYECGNPIGAFDGVKAPTSWNINGQSYIKKGTNANPSGRTQGTITDAKPGDRLNWYHDLGNLGPNDMNRDVAFQVDKTGFSNGWNGITQPSGNARGPVSSLFVMQYANNNSPYTLYDVTQDDVGNTVCQSISWTPASSGNSGRGRSTPACAYVPYNYTLVPTLTLDRTPDSAIETNTDVEVTGTVKNDGPTKSAPNTNWQLVQVIVNPGTPIPQIGNTTPASRANPNAPCGYYTGAGVTCTRKYPDPLAPYGPTIPANAIGVELSKTTETIGDVPVGSKVCFGISVQPYSSTSSNWAHSQLVCLVVSKKPNLNVIGGDVIVGKGNIDGAGNLVPSNIVTSTSSKKLSESDKRIFGSWGEYGVIASGKITGMASGAGYAGGQDDNGGAVGGATYCSVSYLTFTNGGNGVCDDTLNKGSYSVSTTFPAMTDAFSTTGAGNLSGDLSLDTKPSGTYTATSGLILRASTMVKGKSIIINAPAATIYIDGNLGYTTDPLVNATEIPQLVIIAKNIMIRSNVINVDAWLIASSEDGTLTTCYDRKPDNTLYAYPSELTATRCAEKLTVNGPVIARHANLYRTAGAAVGPLSDEPAESFNLHPDAYLWASNYKSGSGRLQTTSTVELPPRY